MEERPKTWSKWREFERNWSRLVRRDKIMRKIREKKKGKIGGNFIGLVVSACQKWRLCERRDRDLHCCRWRRRGEVDQTSQMSRRQRPPGPLCDAFSTTASLFNRWRRRRSSGCGHGQRGLRDRRFGLDREAFSLSLKCHCKCGEWPRLVGPGTGIMVN